jgi:hypothetical protein
MSAQQRYLNDPQYAKLVDTMVQLINTNQFTPSELREAAVMASIKYEMNHVRTNGIHLTPELHQRLEELRAIIHKD